MKNCFILFGFLGLFSLSLFSCDEQNEPEALKIQNPYEQSEEYYENLRAFKLSKHPISCGWYREWTAVGPNMMNYLDGMPDSLDMVFLGWDKWRNLSDEKIKDLRRVQKLKGTKVFISFVISDIGKNFTPAEFNGSDEEREKFWGWDRNDESTFEPAMAKFAKAISDSVYSMGYDGFDLDYEPDFGGAGNMASYSNRMAFFVKELAKTLGPASGSDKMLIIDGQPLYPDVAEETTPLFNYYVHQAYSAYNVEWLDEHRWWRESLFRPEQYVPAVNYESWENGGGSFIENNQLIPKIIGFAKWNPVEGRKGGVGAFCLENDAKHETNFKYIRQAIQIMNPAVH